MLKGGIAMQAIGLLETRSLTGAIDATDAMTKAAEVKLSLIHI